MRKLIILVLIAALFVLSGCGGSSEEEFTVEGLEPAEQVQAIV